MQAPVLFPNETAAESQVQPCVQSSEGRHGADERHGLEEARQGRGIEDRRIAVFVGAVQVTTRDRMGVILVVAGPVIENPLGLRSGDPPLPSRKLVAQSSATELKRGGPTSSRPPFAARIVSLLSMRMQGVEPVASKITPL